MELSKLKMGTRLDLVVRDEIKTEQRPLLVSEFEWADGIDTAYIAAPIVEGIIYPVKIGAYIEAYFIEKLELYRFKAEVVQRGVKDNISLLKVKIRGEFERIQRRQYYRFECSIAVKFREYEKTDEEGKTYQKGLTKDLSGGGLGLLSEEKIEAGKQLEFELKLDENTTIGFTGKVVRSILSDLNEKYRYEHGICFKKIENKDREAVIRFIFNEQRKLRQKGLI